jgi:TetR/AcrR family fatty acid metabolism transcriptional regulator
MHNKDKRRQIMQAAERLFTSRRFHEVTTDQVAHEAHVGKGTIYRHFKTKDELFFETANSGFDELCDVLRRQVLPGAPFAQQLLSACVAISEFHQKRRKLFGMMQAQDSRMAVFKGRLRERWAEKRQALVGAIADILRRGTAQDCVRTDVPLEVLAAFLLGLLRTRAIDLRDASPDLRAYELVVELFLHGARPAGATQAAPGAWAPAQAHEPSVTES